jgi:hypothetical protein
MQNRVQEQAFFRVRKHQSTKLFPVQRAIVPQHLVTEGFNQRSQTGSSRLNHFTGRLIGVEHLATKLGEYATNERLSYSD